MERYLNTRLLWEDSKNPEFPYQVKVGNHMLVIRINDFPAEPLYSLIEDGNVLCDFDEWPACWIKP